MGAFPFRYRPVTLVDGAHHPNGPAYRCISGTASAFFGFIAGFPGAYRDRGRDGGPGRETPLLPWKTGERSHRAWERLHLYTSRRWPRDIGDSAVFRRL